MAVCPRCNANVPDGSERCLVCGYGLPGTVAATEDPKSAEPADSSEAPRGDLTEPGGTFPGTTQQVYSTGTDPGVGAIGGSIYGADAERTSVMGVPATGVVPTDIAAAEPPRRSFPFNAVLIAVVAAIAIGLLVLALTSGTGSGSNSPHHGTSTTTKSHHNVRSDHDLVFDDEHDFT